MMTSKTALYKGSVIYDVHKEDRGKRGWGHEILGNFADGCGWFLEWG